MPPAKLPPGLWAAVWAALVPGIVHCLPLPHSTPLLCLLSQAAIFAWTPSGILLVSPCSSPPPSSWSRPRGDLGKAP